MTTNSNENEEKVTISDHVAETHRSKPVVGQVVTGDIVSGEVRKDEETGDGDTES
jgi:hypothetical protein